MQKNWGLGWWIQTEEIPAGKQENSSFRISRNLTWSWGPGNDAVLGEEQVKIKPANSSAAEHKQKTGTETQKPAERKTDRSPKFRARLLPKMGRKARIESQEIVKTAKPTNNPLKSAIRIVKKKGMPNPATTKFKTSLPVRPKMWTTVVYIQSGIRRQSNCEEAVRLPSHPSIIRGVKKTSLTYINFRL
ncbi:hypothetical protein AXF42_Ash014197 [Apostasia shenzhenica]|uniref:Uncharacterized protein n=1 Tax=Apostasia shenzhenica TaxID=1088818 RepID=A0A2I0A176_9ASPA|nr:hypothetical protein AXF42_Ash014197 [Apostasia shenzhenica]